MKGDIIAIIQLLNLTVHSIKNDHNKYGNAEAAATWCLSLNVRSLYYILYCEEFFLNIVFSINLSQL